MKPIFIDLHIHTSEKPDKLNKSYDLDLLKEKIEEIAEDSDYLISLTDHNTINKPVYLKAVDKFENILQFPQSFLSVGRDHRIYSTYQVSLKYEYEGQ